MGFETRAPVASESRPDASGAPDAIATWRTVAVEGDIATPLPLGCGAASAGGDPNLVERAPPRRDDHRPRAALQAAVGSRRRRPPRRLFRGTNVALRGRIGVARRAAAPRLAACADASSDGAGGGAGAGGTRRRGVRGVRLPILLDGAGGALRAEALGDALPLAAVAVRAVVVGDQLAQRDRVLRRPRPNASSPSAPARRRCSCCRRRRRRCLLHHRGRRPPLPRARWSAAAGVGGVG